MWLTAHVSYRAGLFEKFYSCVCATDGGSHLTDGNADQSLHAKQHPHGNQQRNKIAFGCRMLQDYGTKIF